MVFSSIPTYLDPTNWQQQLNQQIGSGLNPQLQPPQPLSQQHVQQTPPPPAHGGGAPGSIRPGSMSDRARMANIPMPEAALKCPRCDSTNTKFCYFNNYSLTQPRHFCKTCRRYWTRGGALRNVPVGGGCRRNNKRSKGSGNNSKSPASSGDHQAAVPTGSGTGSMISNSTSSGISASILGLTSQIPQLRFMSPLSQLTHDFGSSDIGVNYGGNSAPAVVENETNFHIGSSLFSGGGGGSASVLYPFQGQQFPFLGGLDQSGQGLFSYQGGGGGSGGDASEYVGSKLSNSMLSQVASVKMENPNINNNNQDQSDNLARQFMGVNPGNNDQWSGSAWTDLSGFSSSSTSNPL